MLLLGRNSRSTRRANLVRCAWGLSTGHTSTVFIMVATARMLLRWGSTTISSIAKWRCRSVSARGPSFSFCTVRPWSLSVCGRPKPTRRSINMGVRALLRSAAQLFEVVVRGCSLRSYPRLLKVDAFSVREHHPVRG